MLLEKWDFLLDICRSAHTHSEFHELCQYFKGIQSPGWKAPCILWILVLKDGYRTGVSSSHHFVLTLGFLWIWSTKPNVGREEMDRSRAVWSGRDKIAEGWKDFKSLQMKAYKLPQLAKWYPVFHTVPVIHSLIQHKKIQRECDC